MIRAVALVLALTQATSLVARAAPSDDPDTEIARRHFENASGLYEQGKYEAAIGEFEAARRARPLAELDYNIARCLDRLERWREATERYERFLAAAPTHPDAATVRARVVELRRRDAELRARAEAEAPRRRRRWFLAPTLVGIGALALAGVGAGLVGSVAGPYHELDVGACRLGCPPETYADLERRALAGYAVVGVAGGVALVDVALWVALSRKAARPSGGR